VTAPAVALPRDADFELSGGRLCLDLANTVSRRKTDAPIDLLASYAHLVAWARLAGLVDQAGADALLAAAGRQPEDAARVLARAVGLREAIFGVMHALATAEGIPESPLATINAELGRAMAHARVVRADGGFAWGWDEDVPAARALDRPLWAVARSAADLLVSDDRRLIRECAEDRCAWLFLDTSKNKSRRWCDMAVCGNRAKARRHYARVKGRDA
jgi:predicted RNA-binding Zn ribbon-like protein